MSVLSADGITILNPLADLTLRASDETTSIVAVEAAAVVGFGGFREIVFELAVTAVSVTGAGATAQLLAWVQRKTPSGQWDDLLMIASAALLHAAVAAYYVGEHRTSVQAAPTPAAIQDAVGSAAFASRGGWISDSLRVKSKLVTTGTVPAMTWALYARGRA